MVFELDTKDMERHSVELRLYLEKAQRRFEKAKMFDTYERIVKNVLPQLDSAEPNILHIDQISSAEEARRLSNFLGRLIEQSNRTDQHERLQSALRDSLYQSRRKSIGIGGQGEPFCFFCAGGTCVSDNLCTVNGGTNNHFAAIELEAHLNQQRAVPATDQQEQQTLNGSVFAHFFNNPLRTPPNEMRSSTPTAIAAPPTTSPPSLIANDLNNAQQAATNEQAFGTPRASQKRTSSELNEQVEPQTNGRREQESQMNIPSTETPPDSINSNDDCTTASVNVVAQTAAIAVSQQQKGTNASQVAPVEPQLQQQKLKEPQQLSASLILPGSAYDTEVDYAIPLVMATSELDNDEEDENEEGEENKDENEDEGTRNKPSDEFCSGAFRLLSDKCGCETTDDESERQKSSKPTQLGPIVLRKVRTKKVAMARSPVSASYDIKKYQRELIEEEEEEQQRQRKHHKQQRAGSSLGVSSSQYNDGKRKRDATLLSGRPSASQDAAAFRRNQRRKVRPLSSKSLSMKSP